MSSRVREVAFVAVAAVSSTLLAAEKKVLRSALPPAVEKTVQEQAKGADIKAFRRRRRTESSNTKSR